MLASLRNCMGGLVRRIGGCCVHRAPAGPVAAAPTAGGPGAPSPAEATEAADTAATADRSPASEEAFGVTLGTAEEVPPGPWRWRWVWPTPTRAAGMALVAADGTLVLWSPGGFATPGDADDGRPTPDLAEALARLPELAGAAADAEELERQLTQARRVADETRTLLQRAAGAVDDEIGRAGGVTDL